MANLTENYIMWDVLPDIFSGEKTQEVEDKVYKRIVNYYDNGGVETIYNFSYDNWLLKLCWLHKFSPDDKDLAPVFGRHVIHPIRFLKFLALRNRIWNWLSLGLIPLIVFLDMVVRHGIIRRKTAGGDYHTSGLLLDYYVAFSYEKKFTMRALTKLMKTMFKSWDEIFELYHGNPEHYNHKVLISFRENNLDK